MRYTRSIRSARNVRSMKCSRSIRGSCSTRVQCPHFTPDLAGAALRMQAPLTLARIAYLELVVGVSTPLGEGWPEPAAGVAVERLDLGPVPGAPAPAWTGK